MTKRVFFLINLMFTLTLAVSAASKGFTLVIDAGHGGHDAGAIGAISKEKNINLNVALAFGRLVERNCPDVKVIYTRKSDVFIPLHERADIANRNKADLFVSIHTNSLPKGHVARGMETYTLGMHRAADNLDVAKRENSVILIEKDYKQRYQGFDPNSSESYIMFEFIQDRNMAQSVELAKYVQQRTCAAAGRANKGVKQAGFLVLRETSMPSCLIELGFISTPDEEQFLNSDAGIGRMGLGIYQAFADYKRKHDGKTATTIAQDLKDAREGKVMVGKPQTSSVPNADSITLWASEKQGKTVPVVAEEKKSEPVVVAPKEPAPVVVVESSAPVFKVQVLASGYQLKANDPQLKGVQADFYQEGGMYKYTVGASENYAEVYQLRKSLLDRFPQAFIIAFKNGQKANVQEAIQEYRKGRK